MSVSFIPLSTAPGYYTLCAEWAYYQWHKKNGTSLSVVTADYKRRSTGKKLPCTYLALYKKTPIGMVSLKKYDLATRRDLSPWLSALYVEKRFRQRGIGTQMIAIAVQQARKMNIPELFLFADRDNTDPLVSFYGARGWSLYTGADDLNGDPVIIMKYTVTNRKSSV